MGCYSNLYVLHCIGVLISTENVKIISQIQYYLYSKPDEENIGSRKKKGQFHLYT